MWQARQEGNDRGFTLVEMIVVIGIMALLLAIAAGGWQQLNRSNRVDGAIEEIRSVMSAGRIKAQTSGENQYVGVHLTGEKFISTVWGGQFDPTTQTWTGSWRPVEGVDLLAGTSACAPSTTAGVKNFRFTPRGSVSVISGGSTYTIMARSPGGDAKRCLVLNNVTGRARLVP
ncbi:MAG: prepilin-type N-terminal cleavage/methylation domain-containing protein [Bacteroidetes bacterium]|nr:MAG: prepilin-type N-terminal cleavage/methylation domain-containing protein [Bacteroidota bacterium]